jgi:hypothetical protein
MFVLAVERDDLSSNRHPALSFCLSMTFSENRFPLFRITLQAMLRTIKVAGCRFLRWRNFEAALFALELAPFRKRSFVQTLLHPSALYQWLDGS